MASYDAIVIGAGHNGLTSACYLAKAGMSVLVLDAYDLPGGMATSEELVMPGFQSDIHAIGYQFANLSPAPEELELGDHGFELMRLNPGVVHAFPDGTSNGMFTTVEETCDSIGQFSKRDAQTWKSIFEGYLAEKAAISASVNAPPEAFKDQMTALGAAASGPEQFRFQAQSVRAWVDETFEAAETKLLLGTWATHVSVAPDDGGGANLALLFNTVIQDGGNNLVRGGMRNLPGALASVLKDHGGEIRTGARVASIRTENGKAVAVVLTDGEEIDVGAVVLSSIDPRQPALDLLGEDVVGSKIAGKMRAYDYGLSGMSVFLALDGPVTYKSGSLPSQSPLVHCTPKDLDYFATIFAEVRAGLLPSEPFCALWNEGSSDPSRCPEGKELLKIFVTPIPYEIKGDAKGEIGARDWASACEPFADRVIARLERDFVPDLSKRILARTIQTCEDFQSLVPSSYHGTVTHGAMMSYQMGAMRPIPEMGSYRTPVSNLYLCGSGSHPGGGISMLPGRNAAQVVLGER